MLRVSNMEQIFHITQYFLNRIIFKKQRQQCKSGSEWRENEEHETVGNWKTST